MYTGVMETPIYDHKGLTLRTALAARKALKRAVAAAKDMDVARFYGGEVTQEAIVNASWLLLDAMNEEELASFLKQFIPRLEAVMRGQPVPSLAPEPKKAPAGTGADGASHGRRRKSS